MQIKQYVWDVVNANSWLITEENDGLLIDAVDNRELYKEITKLSSLIVILTHCHFDHIIGLNRIREIQPNCIVIATERCSDHIGNVYRNMSSTADTFLAFYQKGKKSQQHIEAFTCHSADWIFDDELNCNWKSHSIRLFSVYGHSKDSLIAVLDNKFLFSGDTLLSIPTVTRLPGGSTRRFFGEDIPKLLSTKAETVFPGHGEKVLYEELLSVYRDM